MVLSSNARIYWRILLFHSPFFEFCHEAVISNLSGRESACNIVIFLCASCYGRGDHCYWQPLQELKKRTDNPELKTYLNK